MTRFAALLFLAAFLGSCAAARIHDEAHTLLTKEGYTNIETNRPDFYTSLECPRGYVNYQAYRADDTESCGQVCCAEDDEDGPGACIIEDGDCKHIGSLFNGGQ